MRIFHKILTILNAIFIFGRVIGASSGPANVFNNTDSPTSFPTLQPSLASFISSPTVVLFDPINIASDTAGNIFVSDKFNNRIYQVNKVKGTSSFLGGMTSPGALWIDSSGSLLYVAESDQVSRVNISSGVKTVIAGGGSVDVDSVFGGVVALSQPEGLWGDTLGNIFIADTNHSRIRMVNNNGIITSRAGIIGLSGYNSDDISATSSLLNHPRGVWVNSLGDIFIADSGNYLIRRIDSRSGNIYTIAGATPSSGQRMLMSDATSSSIS
eukprot:gene4645-6529_t